MPGQQTRGIEHSATSDQKDIEKSAVGKGSILDRCKECDGEGVLYGMYTRNNQNIVYKVKCTKCDGKNRRPLSYPNAKFRGSC